MRSESGLVLSDVAKTGSIGLGPPIDEIFLREFACMVKVIEYTMPYCRLYLIHWSGVTVDVIVAVVIIIVVVVMLIVMFVRISDVVRCSSLMRLCLGLFTWSLCVSGLASFRNGTFPPSSDGHL
jgi:hypothetical protein